LNFRLAILNQREFAQIKLSDDDLRVALDDVVSENALLGGGYI
jgi:hypothetical protein